MDVVGIVAEYNPYHLGHARHLRETRALVGGNAAVVCVMTGDFVQRGEPAAFSKFARAEAVCREGVDLVIELPLPWCLSSAEGFARGAVSLLSRVGCTHLSFGSEAGELASLEKIADCLLEASFQQRVQDIMRADATLSYAAARQQAAAPVCGGCAALLEKPNNILAVEYLKAIRDLHLAMTPLTIQRYGSEHDGEGGELASAAELRKKMQAGEDVSSAIPADAFAVYRREEALGRGRPDRERLETAFLSRLRALPEREFELLPDAADGLGHRLYRAAVEQTDLDAICEAVKTKRFALSRIRRMVFCALLGVKAGMADGLPPYARILAANGRGREILRKAADNQALPILTKPAFVREMDRDSLACFELCASAHDLYVLGYADPNSRRGGEDWRTGPVIL